MRAYTGLSSPPETYPLEFNLGVKLNEKRDYNPSIFPLLSKLTQSHKMSSNVTAIISKMDTYHADLVAQIAALKAEVTALRAQGVSKIAAPAASVNTKPADKKKRKVNPDAPKRAPNAWITFTKRVRDLLKDNGYTEQAVGVDAPMFCSALKTENGDLAGWSDADILARRAAWTRPTVSKQAAAGLNKKGSAPSSVVSGGDDLDGEAPVDNASAPAKKRKNPWEGLSPEQRAAKVAAMKAGKNAKNGATTTTDAVNTVPVSTESTAVNTVTSAASSSPKFTPTTPQFGPSTPKMEPVTETAVTTSNAVSNAASSSSAVSADEKPKKVVLNNVSYWVFMSNGHAYIRNKDDTQGDWAGIFSKVPKPHIDACPEPKINGWDDDELKF